MSSVQFDPNTGKQQSDEDRAEATSYCKNFALKQSERTTWEPHWQECIDYIVPRKSDVIATKTDGTKRGNELFDTTAIMANTMLAGALHGMLTNPQIKFFELIAEDEKLNELEDVRVWLQSCSDRMFSILNHSNFQTEVHEIYIDLGAIGTACLYMGDHAERIVHFSARPIKEIYIDENSEGLVDSVDRCFKWKARQILQEFGPASVPREIIQKCNEGATDDFEVLHCTHPVSDEEYEARGKIYKFKSVYVLKEMEFLLSRKNFHEFPFAVPRWSKTSGEKYGRGPGMDMLPDIKMVDKMMETTLQGAQKTVNPPLMVSDDGVIGQVRLTPGGLTVIRPTSEVPIKALITDARIDFGLQMIDGVRQRIRSGFYVDQLQLPEQAPQMTATEVSQRTQEKLRLMGPVLGRQHFEFLKPLIDRVFGICVRKGVFDAPPDRLRGQKIAVQYSSLLARAQKAQEGETIMRAMGVVGPLVQAIPSTLDNLNGDKTFKHIMQVYGVPEKIFNKTNEVQDLRQKRQEAQAAMAKQQAEAHQAEVANKTGSAAAQMIQATKDQGK
jgi:hypothetical protein